MKFDPAYITGVKANLKTNEITVTFTVSVTHENMEVASRLGMYADPERGSVEINILPRQIPLFDKPVEVKFERTA